MEVVVISMPGVGEAGDIVDWCMEIHGSNMVSVAQDKVDMVEGSLLAKELDERAVDLESNMVSEVAWVLMVSYDVPTYLVQRLVVVEETQEA